MHRPTDKLKEIEFSDIQALARFGHGQLRDSRFLLLQVKDQYRAGSWLLHSSFTAATVQHPAPIFAMQAAFTAAGLRAVGLPDVALKQFSDEFQSGISGDENRSRRLGDVGVNAPSSWLWGHDDADSIHVLLMIYTSKETLDEHLARVIDHDFKRAFTIVHTLPSSSLEPKEPFGFLDGISQPAIDWEQDQQTDTHSRQAYSNLLAPGEIVLGYRNEYGQFTRTPLVDVNHSSDCDDLPDAQVTPHKMDLGKNGTYLVLRQLRQNIDEFRQFLHQQSDGDAEKSEALAGRMVGRHRNGSPLISPGRIAITGIPSSHQQNNFNYDADPHGLQCPIGAHIRRSNPRTGDLPQADDRWLSRLARRLGFKRGHEYEDLIASSRFHRILRRGRAYGTPVSTTQSHSVTGSENDTQTSEQGLQFICLTANIVRQFEFVQEAWAISASFAGTREQQDPLLGHRRISNSGLLTDKFMEADIEGPQHKIDRLPQFVTVRGGSYFFMPGLRAIHYLGKLATQEAQS